MSVAVFQTTYRVYFEDTDAGGVVYHANYLRFMERARSDWLASLGCSPKQPTDEWGIVFAVRSASLEFLYPARLGDVLEVTVELVAVRGASLDILQKVFLNESDEQLVRGELRIACMNAQRFSVCRIPDELRNRLN